MGRKVERLTDLGDDVVKFLFFRRGELHVGENGDEEHKSILDSSDCPQAEITHAGFLTNGNKLVIINPQGSRTLGVGKRDAGEVINFIRALPDLGSKNVK